ncbi:MULTISPECIES: hypothetical protein [unclassified Microbacterium]|uniref:alginate O-acetyltransferase AlgX-related protein n=1 Tax=unclassified Microbacterium TaxID=2609290 RepID=UPI00214B754D|nr:MULTISPECIES: hypothetical protein [unclassified Microbacterium]MCR2785213.1 hypothetical protein [Microbacterium sp. zg.B96]WIM16745.1 hypothetical protein QNO11_03630 [Microbacterium sp. zg-B96]
MTGAGPDVVHGAQVPSPKWWRPFRNVPLITLGILSLLAALVGWVTQYRIDQAEAAPAPTAATQPTPSTGAVDDVCRPPVEGTGEEPWIDSDGQAEARWEQHAADLSGPVVLGRDGWAFYNDQIEENFSQSIGRRYLSAAEAGAWHDYFESVSTALADRGISLTIQVTPSAGSVYPQQLPEWTDGIVGSTPLDQFLASSPDLPIVDFRQDLREASQGNAVYSPVNSHWTDWGGYIGWQTFADCNAVLHPEDDPIQVPPVEGVQIVGEFNEYAPYGVPGLGQDWTAPVFAEQLPEVEITDNTGEVTIAPGGSALDLNRLPASTLNSQAPSSQKALILRDSMGNALSPFWQQQYAQTWQVQHRFDNWSTPPNFNDLVEQYQPDVVIVQLAERHLVNAPAVPSGY